MVRKKIQFTKEGYAEVKTEYAQLQIDRTKAVELLRKYREMGDLSENSAYRAAKWKLSTIDRRLRHLENLIKYGEVHETRAGIVDIGCMVQLRHQNAEVTYTLVGGFEADPSKGRITQNSPVGRAIMGKRIGDQATIHVPAGIQTYEIIDITPV